MLRHANIQTSPQERESWLCCPVERTDRLNDKTAADRVTKRYFLSFSLASDLASAFPSATAWAFAPRTSVRNGWAATGAATWPNSKARVVTWGPYIACRESLS